MQLSKDTIQTLQQLCNISTSFRVLPGNIVSVRNYPRRTVMAIAELDTTFPSAFAIYDMSQFLGLLSASKNADVEFFDKYLQIKGDGVINFKYADPSLIEEPPQALPPLVEVFQTTVAKDTFAKIQKVSNIIGATHMVFEQKNGTVFLRLTNPKDPTANTFELEVGSSTESFHMVMSMENLAFINDEYTVSLVKATGKSGGIVRAFLFSSQTKKIKYLVAAEISSSL